MVTRALPYVFLASLVPVACSSPSSKPAQKSQSKAAPPKKAEGAPVATADKPMLTPKPLQPQTSNVPDCVAQDRASTAMISGDAMARFVPATLGGVSSHSRQVYPGKIIAAYAVDGGWANLDVGGIIASVDLCTYITCKTPVEVGGHRACMAKTPDRYSLKFLFEKRIVLTMSAPKERTVLTMLASIDLTGLDRLAKSAK